MNNMKAVQWLNAAELFRGVQDSASWHAQYSDSAYVYVGGFDYKLTEGDLIAIFSQYGEIVDINLVRDKQTGKSKGFAFIAYEDQRSTVLAVDNFNGIKVLGRSMRVDHVGKYRGPKKDDDYDSEEERQRKMKFLPSHLVPKEWKKGKEDAPSSDSSPAESDNPIKRQLADLDPEDPMYELLAAKLAKKAKKRAKKAKKEKKKEKKLKRAHGGEVEGAFLRSDAPDARGERSLGDRSRGASPGDVGLRSDRRGLRDGRSRSRERERGSERDRERGGARNGSLERGGRKDFGGRREHGWGERDREREREMERDRVRDTDRPSRRSARDRSPHRERERGGGRRSPSRERRRRGDSRDRSRSRSRSPARRR
ncbi:RNA-binding motif protein, X-linked 2 [Rhizophlyctis rosea]|nr:RNA-binding motif protein, X-linked 2 [Rhizophlyctis rosea]